MFGKYYNRIFGRKLLSEVNHQRGNYQPEKTFDEKKQKSGDAETLEPARKG